MHYTIFVLYYTVLSVLYYSHNLSLWKCVDEFCPDIRTNKYTCDSLDKVHLHDKKHIELMHKFTTRWWLTTQMPDLIQCPADADYSSIDHVLSTPKHSRSLWCDNNHRTSCSCTINNLQNKERSRVEDGLNTFKLDRRHVVRSRLIAKATEEEKLPGQPTHWDPKKEGTEKKV